MLRPRVNFRQDRFAVLEKKTLRASEQDPVIRAAWRAEAAGLVPDDLVFLDETGSHLGYTPTHARAAGEPTQPRPGIPVRTRPWSRRSRATASAPCCGSTAA